MDKMTIYPENPSDPIWSTIETNFQIPLNIIEIVG